MAKNKYHFERLTPTDSVDLDVYEEAMLENQKYNQQIY